MIWTSATLARVIDHTALKADATTSAIQTLCKEALQFNTLTVCINPTHVALCAELLKGSQTLPITVVGFPLGASTTSSKVFETCEAITNGAQEIDMVLNIGQLKSGQIQDVESDIRAVVDAAGVIPVKVILETSLLTEHEKRLACEISKSSGAAFVKTSTGFSTGGATVADIELMRRTVGPDLGVKASGGIRDLRTAVALLNAGANRLGCSATANILKEAGE